MDDLTGVTLMKDLVLNAVREYNNRSNQDKIEVDSVLENEILLSVVKDDTETMFVIDGKVVFLKQGFLIFVTPHKRLKDKLTISTTLGYELFGYTIGKTLEWTVPKSAFNSNLLEEFIIERNKLKIKR